MPTSLNLPRPSVFPSTVLQVLPIPTVSHVWYYCVLKKTYGTPGYKSFLALVSHPLSQIQIFTRHSALTNTAILCCSLKPTEQIFI